ncbi:MAG: galactokinase family protein [Sphaerochaetaceae bacterium]|nr:galactokinase [Sphaerochaetaceae bacterium]MDC7238398.1 galactokinase family protein [Sphaerochaetaceae bacterium]
MISIEDIKNQKLHTIYPKLYGNNFESKKKDNRFIKLLEAHSTLFNKSEANLFSTAGRSELGGNHTDHNLGKVLAATINLDTIAAVNKSDDNTAVLISEGFPAVTVDLNDLSFRKDEENTTSGLLRGIAYDFKKRGLKIGGFVANTSTNVLKGSGLSSSAAIEVLCATIFNNLYNNDILQPVELAKIGQFAENVYYGKPSGLMDQSACASGGIISIDFKDNSNPLVTQIPFNFNEFGYNLIIVDTKGSHDDLTHCYSAIPEEMKSIANYFDKEVLREVPYELFFDNIYKVRKTINNDRAILRAIHYFNENIRVDKMVKALQEKDIKQYLKLVNQSGQSSYNYLQNLYAHPTEQGLGLALATLESILQGKGAVRVHGGGFAGTVQAYIPIEDTGRTIKIMESIFGKNCVTILSIRENKTLCFA